MCKLNTNSLLDQSRIFTERSNLFCQNKTLLKERVCDYTLMTLRLMLEKTSFNFTCPEGLYVLG